MRQKTLRYTMQSQTLFCSIAELQTAATRGNAASKKFRATLALQNRGALPSLQPGSTRPGGTKRRTCAASGLLQRAELPAPVCSAHIGVQTKDDDPVSKDLH